MECQGPRRPGSYRGTSVMICEICNKRDVHILYDRKATAAGRDIYQCEHCNLIFTSPHDYVHQLCDDSQIKNLYLEMSEFREPVLVDNLQQIERIKGKGRILDLVCRLLLEKKKKENKGGE